MPRYDVAQGCAVWSADNHGCAVCLIWHAQCCARRSFGKLWHRANSIVQEESSTLRMSYGIGVMVSMLAELIVKPSRGPATGRFWGPADSAPPV